MINIIYGCITTLAVVATIIAIYTLSTDFLKKHFDIDVSKIFKGK